MLRKRTHDDSAISPSAILSAAVHSKRARLDARLAARLAAAVIDLSRDSPFAFIDLRTPATPLYASPRPGLACALASPALPASASAWAAEGPARASPPSAAALAPLAPGGPPSPDAPILDSPGPVWTACLNSLKERMPAVYGAFVRQMASAREECSAISVAAAAANAAAANAAANAKGPSGALAANVAAAPAPEPAAGALAFDGSSAMSVENAERYVKRLPRWAECSESTEVFAYIYIERIRAREPRLAVRPHNVRRLFAVALILAIKFHEEREYRMRDWARYCGIRLPELLALELRALELLDWRLAVSPGDFEAFLAGVAPMAAAPAGAPEGPSPAA